MTVVRKLTSEELYSKGKNDECFTPRDVVEAILPYLPKDLTYWCPFDDENSNFVKVLKENHYRVTYSHIDYGMDFFKYEPEHWDAIISNPPFTNKKEIFKRALSFNKPFALLMTMTWLNDSAPKDLFYERDLQLFLFRDRIKFIHQDGTPMENKVNFAVGFYCWNLLPKQIIVHNPKLSDKRKEIPEVDFENVTKGDWLWHFNTGPEHIQEVVYGENHERLLGFPCSATLFRDKVENFTYIKLNEELLYAIGFKYPTISSTWLSIVVDDYMFTYDLYSERLSVFYAKDMNTFDSVFNNVKVRYLNELQGVLRTLHLDQKFINDINYLDEIQYQRVFKDYIKLVQN